MTLLGLSLVLIIVGVALLMLGPQGYATRGGQLLVGAGVALLILIAVLAALRQVAVL